MTAESRDAQDKRDGILLFAVTLLSPRTNCADGAVCNGVCKTRAEARMKRAEKAVKGSRYGKAPVFAEHRKGTEPPATSRTS